MKTQKVIDYIEQDDKLRWKINSCAFLKEVFENNEGMGIFKIPANVFLGILTEVALRASEINDPRLNALMCRLALYAISDPYCPEFDRELCEKTIKKGYQ